MVADSPQLDTDFQPLLFNSLGSRQVVTDFSAGHLSSDGGMLLLRQIDEGLGISRSLAACFSDLRNPLLIEHSVRELVAQRLLGLAAGYEDLNDHSLLRLDPLFAVAVGKEDPLGTGRAPQDQGKALASASTLNRLELGNNKKTGYHKISANHEAIPGTLLRKGVSCLPKHSKEVVIDLDASDDPLHGQQEGRFFHGYYDCYCYLPLYVFCGDQLLVAKLRRADIDASAGAADEIARVIARNRARWPKVRIILRADSGFAREELMAWCESNDVEFLFGLAQNSRLNVEIAADLAAAAETSVATGKPARRFKDFKYRTLDSWSRERRVIGKAEWMTPSLAEADDTTPRRKKKKAKKARKAKAVAAPPAILLPGRANPRFIVTSLKAAEHEARALYEKRYCARGEMENHIKECQLDLFADRTSSHTMRANQLRLWFASFAYVLMSALRRIGLTNTRLADATCGTIRLKLLKIGALVKTSFRRILFSMPSAFPYVDDYAAAWAALHSAA